MKNENFEHVLSIAKELEAIAAGDLFKCPKCGEWISADNAREYDDGSNFFACTCGVEFAGYDAEPVGMWEYFNDCLDITYYSKGRGADDYQGARIMVTCGGPNIFIDSKRGTVELYWGTETATCDLLRDAVDAIDGIMSEMWACQC